MSNPSMDHQVRNALQDDQKADEFAQQMAELAAQIVNGTFRFAEDVKSAYESFPKRRSGDKNFDEIDQARLVLGAFAFFMHALDRSFVSMDAPIMRDTIFDFIFGSVVQRVYTKSFTGALVKTEKFALNYFDRLTSQLAEAPTIFGESPENRNTAIWHASRTICEEDLRCDDRRLLVVVKTHLMRGLEDLAFADKITAMAELLSLPSPFEKLARADGKSDGKLSLAGSLKNES